MKILIEALSGLKGDASLDVIGPHEDRIYLEDCQKAAALLPAGKEVKFLDAIPHGEVVSSLPRYSAFLTATASENFGHSIAEAMSMGCVTYAPPTTPWTESLRHAGTLVPTRYTEDWTRALQEHIDLSADAREERRERALSAYLESRDHSHQVSVLDYVRNVLETEPHD